MGEIKNIQIGPVRPTEGIYDYKLESVLSFYLCNRQSELNPPAVREHEGFYLTLDGGHRLLIATLLGFESIDAYVAEDPDDLIKSGQIPGMFGVALSKTNGTIAHRFSLVLEEAAAIAAKSGIQTFSDLRAALSQDRPYLASLDALVSHFGYDKNPPEQPQKHWALQPAVSYV